MSRKTQKGLGAIAVAVVVLVLYPALSRGEPGLLFVLLLFVGGGAFIVRSAFRSEDRWARYALMGVIPGFIFGGLGLGLLSWAAGWGQEGWKDLAAVGAGIMGSFTGAIAGAVIGGLWGRRMDQRRGGKTPPTTNRS